MQQKFTAVDNYRSRTEEEKRERVTRIMETIINNGNRKDLTQPRKRT